MLGPDDVNISLSAAEIKHLRSKLADYEYDLLTKMDRTILAIRSNRDIPDFMEDLEKVYLQIDENDAMDATHVCLIGNLEVIPIKPDILKALMSKRKEDDEVLIIELREKLNREYGKISFQDERDPYGTLRLAVRAPMEYVSEQPGLLHSIFTKTGGFRDADVYYVIGDSNFVRLPKRKMNGLMGGGAPAGETLSSVTPVETAPESIERPAQPIQEPTEGRPSIWPPLTTVQTPARQPEPPGDALRAAAPSEVPGGSKETPRSTIYPELTSEPAREIPPISEPAQQPVRPKPIEELAERFMEGEPSGRMVYDSKKSDDKFNFQAELAAFMEDRNRRMDGGLIPPRFSERKAFTPEVQVALEKPVTEELDEILPPSEEEPVTETVEDAEPDAPEPFPEPEIPKPEFTITEEKEPEDDFSLPPPVPEQVRPEPELTIHKEEEPDELSLPEPVSEAPKPDPDFTLPWERSEDEKSEIEFESERVGEVESDDIGLTGGEADRLIGLEEEEEESLVEPRAPEPELEPGPITPGHDVKEPLESSSESALEKLERQLEERKLEQMKALETDVPEIEEESEIESESESVEEVESDDIRLTGGEADRLTGLEEDESISEPPLPSQDMDEDLPERPTSQGKLDFFEEEKEVEIPELTPKIPEQPPSEEPPVREPAPKMRIAASQPKLKLVTRMPMRQVVTPPPMDEDDLEEKTEPEEEMPDLEQETPEPPAPSTAPGPEPPAPGPEVEPEISEDDLKTMLPEPEVKPETPFEPDEDEDETPAPPAGPAMEDPPLERIALALQVSGFELDLDVSIDGIDIIANADQGLYKRIILVYVDECTLDTVNDLEKLLNLNPADAALIVAKDVPELITAFTLPEKIKIYQLDDFIEQAKSMTLLTES